jgi:hypothetical protein
LCALPKRSNEREACKALLGFNMIESWTPKK